MKYKEDEQSSLKGHSTGQPKIPQYAVVPATLLSTVLSHLGLGDRPIAKGYQTVAALRDERSHVRVAAVRSLGERREVSSLQLLVSALRDPAWEVRAAAVWAFSTFGGQTPVEALKEALEDEDSSVRAAALRVLARVRGQISPELLARMLRDTDWQVHEAVKWTEEELREQATPEPSVVRLIEVLGDRYQLQDPIGRGGMATIYRARDRRMDRVVAVKVLREVYSTDPKFVRRFQVEAKAASALQHPNIVQVYDYGQTDGNYYIVMELVEGTDLRRYLHSRGVLDVDRAVIIAHDVALGLGAAHRRDIVHRDVKPQNVLVGRNGSIKLTDFGIASVYKDIHAERLTTTGMTLGTVQYYAPEQAQGEIVSPAADVYALGIVMYEMLTGRTPFDGENAVAVAMQHIENPPISPRQFNPSIPLALEEIILRCLEKVPEMRFRDGSELARALELLADSELDEAVVGPLAPGHASVPITYYQIPPRPDTSGRSTTRDDRQHSTASSSDQMLNGDSSTTDDGAGGVGETDDKRTVPLNQQKNNSPMNVPESGAPRPGQLATVPRSGVIRQNSSRFATIITGLILLATLILLGFSINLAAELHFITLPFFNGGSTPTPSVVYTTVPPLQSLSWSQAQASATKAGFTLQSNNGTAGVVVRQSFKPGDKVPKGTTIYVTMGSNTVKIPDIPPGTTLASYEALLQSFGFHNYSVKSDGEDQNVIQNTVSKVSPSPGRSVAVDTQITIYVKNLI